MIVVLFLCFHSLIYLRENGQTLVHKNTACSFLQAVFLFNSIILKYKKALFVPCF